MELQRIDKVAVNCPKTRLQRNTGVLEVELHLFLLSIPDTWYAVRLYMVPGHAGVQGNEIADELARSGSAL